MNESNQTFAPDTRAGDSRRSPKRAARRRQHDTCGPRAAALPVVWMRAGIGQTIGQTVGIVTGGGPGVLPAAMSMSNYGAQACHQEVSLDVGKQQDAGHDRPFRLRQIHLPALPESDE